MKRVIEEFEDGELVRRITEDVEAESAEEAPAFTPQRFYPAPQYPWPPVQWPPLQIWCGDTWTATASLDVAPKGPADA